MARHLGKLLRKEAAESRAEDVDPLEAELVEEVAEAAAPVLVCPVHRPGHGQHAVTSTGQC